VNFATILTSYQDVQLIILNLDSITIERAGRWPRHNLAQFIKYAIMAGASELHLLFYPANMAAKMGADI